MSEMNKGEALKPRVKKIMHHVSYRKGGRFTGFNPNIHTISYEFRSDNEILFWVDPGQKGMPYCWDRWAQAVLSDIDFKSLDNVVLSEPVKLDAKVIDAQVLRRDNRNGTEPLKTTYSGEFSDVEKESTTFGTEMTAGIKASVGYEGLASASVEAYTEWKATFEKSGGHDHSETRTITDEFNIPAGELWVMTGKREIADMQRTATGKVDLSHKVWIGSYQSHHLGKHRWDWTYSWDSFDAFVNVVKCAGAGDLANEFRNDKVPQNMIDALVMPTDAEVKRTYTFPHATWSDVDVQVTHQ